VTDRSPWPMGPSEGLARLSRTPSVAGVSGQRGSGRSESVRADAPACPSNAARKAKSHAQARQKFKGTCLLLRARLAATRTPARTRPGVPPLARRRRAPLRRRGLTGPLAGTRKFGALCPGKARASRPPARVWPSPVARTRRGRRQVQRRTVDDQTRAVPRWRDLEPLQNPARDVVPRSGSRYAVREGPQLRHRGSPGDGPRPRFGLRPGSRVRDDLAAPPAGWPPRGERNDAERPAFVGGFARSREQWCG
jgi:hypothetical protein